MAVVVNTPLLPIIPKAWHDDPEIQEYVDAITVFYYQVYQRTGVVSDSS